MIQPTSTFKLFHDPVEKDAMLDMDDVTSRLTVCSYAYEVNCYPVRMRKW